MTLATPPSERHALILSHAHPDFSKGGAEVAAHGLYSGLNRCEGWKATLLAGHRLKGLASEGSPWVIHRGSGAAGSEMLFPGETDPFYFESLHGPELFRHFRRLLETLKPDVVHFHHYWNVGLELILAVKRHDPAVPVLVTLHEYLAICLQNGQMLKTSGELCQRGSPALCHACLPRHAPAELFLREHYLKSVFSAVDLFVAPSAFLKQRYVDWGLPAERIEVLENGQVHGRVHAEARRTAGWRATSEEGQRPRSRFAYFGQITPFKGLDVLLEAFEKLTPALAEQAHLDIYGGGGPHLPEAFRDRVDTLLGRRHHNVQQHGAYVPEDLGRLIDDVDWVVVPSIWWENSPMVIQEAFLHGRPVICADIGGMAEKVRNNVDGLHFRVRNARDLARQIERAATTPGLWERLASAIRRPPAVEDGAAAHAHHYLRLIDGIAAPDRASISNADRPETS